MDSKRACLARGCSPQNLKSRSLSKSSIKPVDRAPFPMNWKAAERSAGDGSRRGPTPVEDEIYELLTRAIIMKQIRPGGRIPEAALASSFKVSRARVHRVLQRLADLDGVEFRLNFRALVLRASPQAT